MLAHGTNTRRNKVPSAKFYVSMLLLLCAVFFVCIVLRSEFLTFDTFDPFDTFDTFETFANIFIVYVWSMSWWLGVAQRGSPEKGRS